MSEGVIVLAIGLPWLLLCWHVGTLQRRVTKLEQAARQDHAPTV